MAFQKSLIALFLFPFGKSLLFFKKKSSKPKLVRQENVSGKKEMACLSSLSAPRKHLPLVESESFNSENTLPTPADEDHLYDQVQTTY